MNNLRIHSNQPLITPESLIQEFPISENANEVVKAARNAANRIIQGGDDRLLVIVGPCSIHDSKAALEYAALLQNAAQSFKKELCIIMRVYFEKPRTTVGWKGLISDPFLNGSFDMNCGLRIARNLLLEINNLGMAAATEFLDTIVPQYLSDLISWSAIGARTSASQTHRELASGLPMAVGFKNSTDGNIKIAIDAVKVASHPHHFLSICQNGTPAIVRTTGNNNCHIILRGSQHGPNYETQHIIAAVNTLQNSNLIPRLMIDCSHGNSMKDYQRQHQIVQSITEQIENGSDYICGVMLESNLIAGNQTLDAEQPLVYGQSITDGCISWEETLILLEKLANAMTTKKKVIPARV
jgi:3-deoxy-7-phosphoheptulonate synthase